MSVIEPEIDKLLDLCDNDRFLLCAIASKRSKDINNMMHGQRDRALALQSLQEVTEISGKKPLSIAMNEIASGEVSYHKDHFANEIDHLNDKFKLGNE
ncbi:MAG: DNA-directed RNA polymerase subunit omega [Coriobacteriia bacterium]|nr:DNA-directed RNA polymerase subunit omega [Coriobacteriia bacterium]